MGVSARFCYGGLQQPQLELGSAPAMAKAREADPSATLSLFLSLNLCMPISHLSLLFGSNEGDGGPCGGGKRLFRGEEDRGGKVGSTEISVHGGGSFLWVCRVCSLFSVLSGNRGLRRHRGGLTRRVKAMVSRALRRETHADGIAATEA